jgi:protein CMS1
VKRIVVDASHIDQKKRGIVDMRETMLPLAKLLCRGGLKERYEDDDAARHIDLIFY